MPQSLNLPLQHYQLVRFYFCLYVLPFFGSYFWGFIGSLLNGGRKHPDHSDAAQMMGAGLEDILAVPAGRMLAVLCHRGLLTEVGQDRNKVAGRAANGTKSALCSRKMSFLTGQTNAARWEVACEDLCS